MTILIAVLLGIGALILVGYPLFKRKLEPEGPFEDFVDDERQKLVSEKDSALSALKELDFDYQTGKLDDEDYHHLRDRYRAKALTLLKEVDETARAESFEKEIERGALTSREEEVAEVVKTEGANKLTCPYCGEKYSPGDKFCPECGTDLGALSCSTCGAEYEKGDKFCPSCGQALP